MRREFHFNNYAQPIGAPTMENEERVPYFRWKIFMDEPDNVLDEVQSVEYKLHPTFPNPVRSTSDKSSRFALETEGWGEFAISIAVHMNDGSVQHERYWLDLGRPWPTKPPPSEVLPTAGNSTNGTGA